jgi:predicted GH43/DUF377 family glycosyl hydrolase
MYSAGAVKIDKTYLLLLTVEDLAGKSAVYLARSEDGFRFDVDEKPFIAPSAEERYKVFEENGVLDARITFLAGKYYIVFLGRGQHGILLELGETADFTSFKRLGVISQPDNKAGALFPVKVGGRYIRLERPGHGQGIWLGYSKDLLTWGEREVVMLPRPGFWDTHRIGCAAPPMAIKEGWLLIYYGVKVTSAGNITRLGAALLDREQPWKVQSRTNIPILSPREDYERIGDINNMVFSAGAIIEDDGEVKIYYAAADNCLCVGTTKLADILANCLESRKEY